MIISISKSFIRYETDRALLIRAPFPYKANKFWHPKSLCVREPKLKLIFPDGWTIKLDDGNSLTVEEFVELAEYDENKQYFIGKSQLWHQPEKLEPVEAEVPEELTDD